MPAGAAAAEARIGVAPPGRTVIVAITMAEGLADCGDLAHAQSFGGSVTLVMSTEWRLQLYIYSGSL